MIAPLHQKKRVRTPERDAGLSVVTVAYNSAGTLPGLLDSLPAGLEGIASPEIVVVDNDSSDGSAEIAEAHAVAPKVIRTGENGGYAAGINRALRTIAPGRHVLILNPDVRLTPGSVRPLLDRIEAPEIGIAVPRNLMVDGAIDPTLRREPSLASVWAESLLGGRLAGRLGFGEVLMEASSYEYERTIDWASGCALLIAARARRLAPEWDESFFLYSEEVEYQRRVREGGLQIAYVARSRFRHIGGPCRSDPQLTALLVSNRIRYFRRHHGALSTALFRLGLAAGEAVRAFRGGTHRTALRTALHPLRPPLSYRAENSG
ncbi:glycosyltransferase [Aureimonas sp. AU40]|uniref:glycosyltransferase n=1 Tax=Aureimonas sp. AU40 TaxID=1637747 RepID=UPI000782B72F|nr:glycosyltransferase [Aureimonas sp. AU40]